MGAPDLLFVVARLCIGCWLLWRLALPAGGPRRPSCTVIIPARNEQGSLPAALAALAPQLGPDDSVVVVDDHSDDDTAEVARAGGAHTVPAPPLPPGWTGKAWACVTGADRATGETLVFVDADTRLAPGALDRLVRTQAATGGMVSACPYHQVVRPYERLSAFFNVLALMGTDAHTPLGARRRPNGAYGPSIVVSAADYAATGGHRAVHGEVLDDVRLAGVWRDAGLPVHLYAGPSISTYRMYPGGWRELADGWTKNFASGASGSRPLSLLLSVLWLSLPIQAAYELVMWALPGQAGRGAAVVWALYAAVVAQVWWMLRRVGSFGLRTAVLFPLPLAAFLAIFVRSIVLTVSHRSVRWKGRLVPTVAPRD